MKTIGAAYLLCAFLGSLASAMGQTHDQVRTVTGDRLRYALGVTAAFTRSEHTGTFGFYVGTDTCDCPWFDDGRGSGYQAGVAFRFPISSLLAIDSRAVFDSRPAHYREYLPEALVLTPGSPDISVVRIFADSYVTYELLTLELLLTARIAIASEPLAFALSIGPTASSVLTGTITQTQEIELPRDARFTNPKNVPTENEGRRLVFLRDSEIPDLAGTRASVKGGLAIELGQASPVLVRVGAYYDHGLTDLGASRDWKVHSLLFQLDALLEL